MVQADLAMSHPRDDLLNRGLAAAGIAAPLVYLFTVAVGGALLTPGYSHIAQPISALIEAGATNAPRLDILFLLYDFLVIAFGASLLRSFARRRPSLALGGLLVVLLGVFGIGMTGLPMDPMGTPVTWLGTAHIILAGLAAATSVGALVCFAFGLRHVEGWLRWARFSFWAVLAVVATGLIAGFAAARGWPRLGLWERLTIGSMQIWMLATAARLAWRNP